MAPPVDQERVINPGRPARMRADNETLSSYVRRKSNRSTFASVPVAGTNARFPICVRVYNTGRSGAFIGCLRMVCVYSFPFRRHSRGAAILHAVGAHKFEIIAQLYKAPVYITAGAAEPSCEIQAQMWTNSRKETRFFFSSSIGKQ